MDGPGVHPDGQRDALCVVSPARFIQSPFHPLARFSAPSFFPKCKQSLTSTMATDAMTTAMNVEDEATRLRNLRNFIVARRMQIEELKVKEAAAEKANMDSTRCVRPTVPVMMRRR